MIYTAGRMMFHRYLSPPPRCRHALPSCASAGAGAKDPSGLRRARGGQRVCDEKSLAGVWGICAALLVGHGCALPSSASPLQVYTLPCAISIAPSNCPA
jgi:hypothetical protein